MVRCAGLIILFSDLAVNAFLVQQLADGLEEVDIQPSLLPKCIESGYGITNLAGELLVPVRNPCAFCQAGWSSSEFWQRCQRSWSAPSDVNEDEARLRVCHAGINYAVAPVQVLGQCLGLVVSCQFLASQPDAGFRRGLRGTAKACGLDQDRLLSEVGSIRVLDAERMQLVTKLLVTIAGALSEIATQNYHVRQKLAQIAQIVKTP